MFWIRFLPSRSVSIVRVAALVLLVALGADLAPGGAIAQEITSFQDLTAGQQVYDETGASLTSDQAAALQQQIDDLADTGASVVVYVRALDATPNETLAQVEALQQAWVATAGVDQDTAVAILINRNPGDPNDARAGIFVGKTWNDGNVPEDEQVAIVEDALIPPLRDGDVYGSFSDGLARLDNSIQFGPPRNAFEKWADGVADGWFPWVMAGLAAIGGVFATRLYRQRQDLGRPGLPPTTARPGDLTPALAGALVAASPQASAIPATLLELAARGAVSIEPESEGGRFSKPAIKVRLRNQDLVQNEVEATLWSQLERRATLGVVSSKDLAKISADFGDVRKLLDGQMLAAGWKDERAGKHKAGLGIIIAAGLGLGVLSFAVAIAAGSWLAAIGVVAMAALVVAAIVMIAGYSSLSRAGQEAALPWRAYRDGLEAAAKDHLIDLDLDATLADTVAMNLGSDMNKRLTEASEAGLGFRAFTSSFEPSGSTVSPAFFPYWVAFNSSVATSSGSTGSTGTVSGGGAGGGGGAAGST
jgi:uncharacterized membrane protein YgcG